LKFLAPLTPAAAAADESGRWEERVMTAVRGADVAERRQVPAWLVTPRRLCTAYE